MSKIVFAVLALCLPLCGQVKITQSAGKVAVEIDGKPFTEFVTQGDDYAKPYLWPIHAASGTVVTRYWPMTRPCGREQRPSSPSWPLVWTDEVNGFNFWANEPSVNQKNPGKQVVKNLKVKSGGQTGTFSAISNGPVGHVLLVEHRTMTFYSGEAAGPQNRRSTSISTWSEDQGYLWRYQRRDLLHAPSAVARISQKKGPQEPKRTGAMVNAQGAKGEEGIWARSPSGWTTMEKRAARS